ncbi:MAG: integron integrase [Candidatus Aegiribacteria sp.]|nr:integron integrase [Candidatus Aegiribacteria sp.]
MKYDLTEYNEHLASLNLVRENHIPYMSGWVKHFLFLGRPSDSEYADILTKEGRKDWQIRQALDAVKIFREVYPENTTESLEKAGTPLKVMKESLRIRHYARSTEKAYLNWSTRYFNYCMEMSIDIKSDSSFRNYLSHLALRRKVAASTQNQAFNALLFLFRNAFSREPESIDAVRARRPLRLPVVLSRKEVKQVFQETEGITNLILQLIYSSGLRLSEGLQLRIHDVDLDQKSITVRSGKGNKDRITVLSSRIIPDLRKQLAEARSIFENSNIPVSLPEALARKYPNAGREWGWQYLFPAANASIDPATGEVRRHHLHPSGIQRAMRKAVRSSGIVKRASIHTLRHSFATHLLMSGVDLCAIQELLGHKNLETTRIYLHVMKGFQNGVTSPLDLLED